MTQPGTGRRWIKWAAIALALFLALPATLVFGYYAHKNQINPIYSTFQRIDRNLAELRDEPTATEVRMALIESTFLRFRGEVYPQPDNDFTRGGALTVWGDDLLVMNRLGKIWWYDPGVGLKPTSIAPPDNGLDAYIAVSNTDKYADYLHKPRLLRFNDILHVDSGDLRGLALSYTFFDAQAECYGTQISWLPLEADADPRSLTVAQSDWEIIYDTQPCLPLNPDWTALDGLAAGGRIDFAAPSTLYLGSGDYHLDGIHTYDAGLQSPDSHYGKVMAIDLATREARIFATGLRNTQGVAVDGQGRLWTTEHGLRGGDELNLVREGDNFGWPLESLGTLYSGLPIPGALSYGRHDTFTQPVYAWLPSAAISTLTVIDGLDPSWDGALLAGSLSSEEFGQSLYHIRIEGERVVFVERIKLERRVRYVTQYGPDKLALWLDTNELVILTAERREDPLARTETALMANFDAGLANRVLEVMDGCNQCHSYEQYNHAAAPSLNGVVGRRIATTSFTGYSDGLKAVRGVWDAEALTAYLNDPQAFAPGTTMAAAGIDDPALMEALIWALDYVNTEDDPDLTYN